MTISIAIMLATRKMPSLVPRVIASRKLDGGSLRTSSAQPSPPASNGTMIAAMASAPGVEITEAMRMCPKASGMTGPSSDA